MLERDWRIRAATTSDSHLERVSSSLARRRGTEHSACRSRSQVKKRSYVPKACRCADARGGPPFPHCIRSAWDAANGIMDSSNLSDSSDSSVISLLADNQTRSSLLRRIRDTPGDESVYYMACLGNVLRKRRHNSAGRPENCLPALCCAFFSPERFQYTPYSI